MFRKKAHIKALAPLRSSDRRRTADQIIKDFDIKLPEHEDTEDTATAARTTLRNALLPENTLKASYDTTHGQDLQKVSGTVYVDGTDQRVLWITVDDKKGTSMYPTITSLWRNPGIIPLLHCGSSVIERLQGGAPLMIPGVLYGPPFPTGATKGAIVAIAGHTKNSVPLVVGKCAVDIANITETRGVKGIAVETFHWYGDEIWAWGKPGGEPPDRIDGWFDEVEDITKRTEGFDLEEEDSGEDSGVALPNNMSETATNGASENAQPEEPPREYTTAEVDSIFTNAFLYGINHHKSAYPSTKNYGLDFPLTQSSTMTLLITPFLPIYTSHDTQQLVIKKTSWKNIKKFIKHLDKKRIVKSKDRDGNESVILDIDFDDESVLSFKPYRLPKKDVPASAVGPSSEDVDGSDPSVGQQLTVRIFYRMPAKLNPLIANPKVKRTGDSMDWYTTAYIKRHVTTYIENENLENEKNKRIISLDAFLANEVFDGSSKACAAIDKEAQAKSTVLRDVLAERVLASCSAHYLIERNGYDVNARPKAGAPPKISITLETRSGNKTATKVSGLETYFIPPQPLADELRKACAGSTSVERLQGSSPKAPVMEVMIQGPQTQAVLKALEKRGVDKRWVDVVDKTKGKGKGR